MLSNQKNNDRFGFLAKKCIFLDPLIIIFCKSRISLYKMTRPSGGVALYVHKKLNPTELMQGIDSNLELVAVKCKAGKDNLIVATTYRPPSYPVGDYVDKLSDFISSLGDISNQLTLMGDLNICALKPEFKIIQDLCDSAHMKQVIQTPTHKNRLIDHIYVHSLAKVTSFGVSSPIEKFHMQTWLKASFSPSPREPTSVSKWNFKKVDWTSFNMNIMKTNILRVVQGADSVHSAAEALQSQIHRVMSDCITKTTCKRRNVYGWITKTIIELFKDKNKSFRKWKQRGLINHQANYRRLKRKLHKEMVIEKRKFFNRLLSDTKDVVSFWKNLNRLRGNRPQMDIPTLRLESDQKAEQDDAKAEALLRQFSSVLGHQNLHCVNLLPNDITYSPMLNCKLLLRKISQLPSRKSPGNDDIPPVVFKKCSLVLAPCLNTIAERCLLEGAFPDLWKEARVIPIPKVSGSPNPADYRPISLLPLGSKLIENQLYTELIKYIEPLLSNVQFGFRSGRSTTDAITLLQHYILKGFELCETSKTPGNVAVIYFDIAKAFDTVPHDKLLHHLKTNYNMPSNILNLLQSYLSNRTMKIKVGQEISKSAHVTSGVPQGSVLGPLLFISYINAIAQLKDDGQLSKWANIILFADDLVYIHPIHIKNARDLMQMDIDIMSGRFNSLGLQLNDKKCKLQIMSLSPRSKTNLSLKLNGSELEIVQVYKYLGVEFDNRLTFGEHTTRMVNSVKRGIGALCRSLRKWAPVEAFSKAILSTTLPIFLYSIESWYPPNLKQRVALERVLKYAIRLILNKFNHDITYEDLLEEIKWKPLYRQVMERRLKTVRKILENRRYLPEEVFPLAILDTRASSRIRSQRNQHNLQLAPATEGSNSLQEKLAVAQMRKLWNGLDEKVVSTNFRGFCEEIKNDAVFRTLCDRGCVLTLNDI
jgi:hypothetical protein